MPRNLKWPTEPRPPARGGRNAYVQAAVTNGVIAVLVIVIAAATGGSILRAVVAVILAWLAGTAYMWWRIKGRRRGD